MSGESSGHPVEMGRAKAEHSADSVTINTFHSVQIGRIEALQVSGMLMGVGGRVLVGGEPRRVMLTTTGWATARVMRQATKRETLPESFMVDRGGGMEVGASSVDLDKLVLSGESDK